MLLPNLLNTCAAAIPAVENVVDRARVKLSDLVTVDCRLNGKALEEHQFATHGLAWFATYLEALRQMHKWATRLDADGKLSELEQLLLQIGFGEYLWQIWGGIPMSQCETVRLQDLGLSQQDQMALAVESVQTLTPARQFTGRSCAPDRTDAGTGWRLYRWHHRSRRRTGNDPRPVPPLRR